MFRSVCQKCFCLGLLTLAILFTPVAGSALPQKRKPLRVLLVGGGASHDFNKWYKGADVKTLEENGFARVTYTDQPAEILGHLAETDVLVLSNNQPIPDEATRKAIFDFLDRGKGVVLLHAAIWYNWKDWPEYNREIVGGGSAGHEKYGSFRVIPTPGKKHPIMKGIPGEFSLEDELYFHKIDPGGAKVDVLASAQKPGKTETFPSIFTVAHPKGRIAAIALGHDAASHELDIYRTLLRNTVRWAAR